MYSSQCEWHSHHCSQTLRVLVSDAAFAGVVICKAKVNPSKIGRRLKVQRKVTGHNEMFMFSGKLYV